jgi:cation diffusion facilitator family transporter
MVESKLKNPLLLSLLAALVTVTMKFTAYRLTGSVGLLSDALESLINVVTALTALFALWYAALPVDASHTYGHEKIEYFSSGLEGVLILVAAAAIAWHAIGHLLAPELPTDLALGCGITLVASLINLAVARILIRAGRARGSIILEADGQHLMADVWTSLGVVVGLVLVWLTSLKWIDPVIGLLVALSIVRSGVNLVRRSFRGLMDHALPVEEQARVRAAIQSCLQSGMDYHALRTRRAGTRRFVDFHLLMPGALTVSRAHALTGQVEEAVRAALPGVEVTVHVEPIEDRAAWEDSALVPLEQAARRAEAERGSGPPAEAP